MKNKIGFLFIALSIMMMGKMTGQSVSGGFKVGFNYSNIVGPSEMDNQGNALETMNFDNGFHIGAIVNFRLSDVLGLRTELLFSQKGTDYSFEGPSYWFFYPDENTTITSTGGTRKTRLFVSTSYFEVPLMIYGRVGSFEFSGGPSIAFLTGSKATGEIKYSSPTIDPFTVALEFNYNKDKPMKELVPNQPRQMVNSAGVEIPAPKTVGAYYAALGTTDKLYNVVDFGLNAGVSYYLNKGLFIGLRANYGLLDVTKNEQDISPSKYDEQAKTFFTNDDVDKNLSFQLSIGFNM